MTSEPRGSQGGVDLFLEMPAGVGRARAVEAALRSAIKEGRLSAGSRLPPTRALAAELGLSRGTVTQAYGQLIAEGWLTAASGRSGTRVAGDVSVHPSPEATGSAALPAPRHDLSPGRPDVSAFPRQAWLRATRRALCELPSEVFGYGDPRGRIELRTVLAGYLGRVRGVRVDPSHLVICSGYTQALSLLTQVFQVAGARRVGMEDPALADHVAIVGARLPVADIPVDVEGIDVRALDAVHADAVVCTPAHQFPLGLSMTAGRRARLLAWAKKRDAWVVEDDYDGEFRYERRPVGALQSSDPGRIAYVGSVSKTLGPGVRLGWIACPPALLDPLIEAKRLADRVTSPLDQVVMAEMIASGAYDRYLRSVRCGYRRRRDQLASAVALRVPRARITGIAAGLHALLQLAPTAPPESEILAALHDESVEVHPLSLYTRGTRTRSAPCLVVGYATPAAHAYSSALDALLGVLEKL